MTAAPSIFLGSSQILAQGVSLVVGFHLHYFSAPSGHFLQKELSQIFAPIPGGGHGTTFDWTIFPQLSQLYRVDQFMQKIRQLKFTTARLKATTQLREGRLR
jgi:hypothetical protein